MEAEALRDQLREVTMQINELALNGDGSSAPIQGSQWRELCALEARLQLILHLIEQEKPKQ